ncbi:hypothetical protein ACIPWB_31900 [[Kitasatospora] papulosa]|uniref:hypothetical protein n=1 Tax=[Kitasatospora] papulosa TaxID=1464011 RepID=UPI0037F9A10D
MKDPRRYATHLVDRFLGARIDAAGHAPGLRETVIDLVAAAVPGHLEPLMRTQLDLLTHPSSDQFPDAYLAKGRGRPACRARPSRTPGQRPGLRTRRGRTPAR